LHELPEEANLASGAMILTSSRARADTMVDLLSDYDLVLAVTDLQRNFRSASGSAGRTQASRASSSARLMASCDNVTVGSAEGL